jgi:hypothetical protein
MTDNLPYFVSTKAIANNGFAVEASKMLQQLEPHAQEVPERADLAAQALAIKEEIAHLTRMKQCLDG